MRLQRRPRLLTAAALCLVAPPLIFGAIRVGLRIPPAGIVASLPRAAQLDFALRRGHFAPLTDRFVGGVLGAQPLSGAPASYTHPNHPESQAPISVDHSFTNDDFSKAYDVPWIPFIAKTDSSSATREGTTEPAGCSPVGGTAWYRYTPRKNVRLIVSTIGTDYATSLAAYSGKQLNELQQVGCARNASGNSLLAFPAIAGTTYVFQIAGPTGGGLLVFNLAPDGATTRASVSSADEQGDGNTVYSVMSRDGRFIAFSSFANFTGDTSAGRQVCTVAAGTAPLPSAACPVTLYLRDRKAHKTLYLGASAFNQTISEDGRYVAYITGSKVVRYDRISRQTIDVSVSSAGEQGNQGPSGLVSMSADGRYVAFPSRATNLVRDDMNATEDVFVRDTVKGTTKRASLSSSNREGNNATSARYCSKLACESGSSLISISTNGRWVVFRSSASNLVPGDTNQAEDVFVRDLIAGTTERVSVSSSGEQANGDTLFDTQGTPLAISDDGRFVVFNSFATNLVPRDTNGGSDVFVRDRLKRTTTLANVSSTSEHANWAYPGPLPGDNHDNIGFSISPDGRHVVFSSGATNLVPEDTNECSDEFVHHIDSGVTVRMTVSSQGVESNGASFSAAISSDGRFVHFVSSATNLVPDDSNDLIDVFVHEVAAPGRSLSDWY